MLFQSEPRMRFWQSLLVPLPEDYSVEDQPPRHDHGFALYDNFARKAEVLLVEPKKLVSVRGTLLRAAKFLSPENMADEILSLDLFEDALKTQYLSIRKGERLWETALSDDAPPDAEAKFLKWIRASPAGETFLPNWLIWGAHRAHNPDLLARRVPEVVASAVVDERNDWMLAANIDYGSFNMRCASFLADAISRGLVAPSSVDLIRRTVSANAAMPAFDLDASFSPKKFSYPEAARKLFALIEANEISENSACSPVRRRASLL